jgi:DNA polymerase III delta subunit
MEIIKEDAFRKQLKKGISGGFLFYGEEDYMKTHALSLARQTVCPDTTFALFNDVRLDALDYSPNALLDALMPPPMMADLKIVSVTGLSISSMRQNEIDDLCDTLSALAEYDYNVLIISIPAGQIEEGSPKRPSSALSKLGAHLTPVLFETVSGARLVSWVAKHFEHNGVQADPNTCAYLIEYCGRSMFTLASEIDKLSYYVLWNGRNTVTNDDIKNVSVSVVTTDAFTLANAILDGRYEDALNALSVMKFRRVDPVIILSEVSRVICDLVSVKSLLEQSVPQSDIARLLFRSNDYKTKIYVKGASAKSMQKLKRALELCSEADLSLKLSPQGYIAIEKLICCL